MTQEISAFSREHPGSFFKLMIGSFKDFLHIPPRFTSILSDAINQHVYVQDPKGKCWMMRLNLVNGSLAFQEGWPEFVVGQNIEYGESVVFEIIGSMMFRVRIYSTSACEKVLDQSENDAGRLKRGCKAVPNKNSHLDSYKKHKEIHQSPTRDSVKNVTQVKIEPCDSFEFETRKRRKIVGGSLKDQKAFHKGKEIADQGFRHHEHIGRSGKEARRYKHKMRAAVGPEQNEKVAMKEDTAVKYAIRPEVGEKAAGRLKLYENNHAEGKMQVEKTTTCHTSGNNNPDFDKKSLELGCNDLVRSQRRNRKVSEVNSEEVMAVTVNTSAPDFLVSEGGTYCNGDQCLTNRNGPAIPVNCCMNHKGKSVCQDKNVTAPHVICQLYEDAPVIQHPPPTDRENDFHGIPHQSHVKSGQEKVCVLGCIKEEVPPIQNETRSAAYMNTGLQQNTFSETNRKKDLPSIQGKDFIVKCEKMDSEDMPPNPEPFKFSISCSSHPRIELPKELPHSMFRNLRQRKVVILRDPLRRLWPVIYANNDQFTGFIGGWQDFVAENNLREGNICKFKALKELEPTLEVKFNSSTQPYLAP